jgi:pimeloyl-ACP methyl ester carboxylesterase
MSRRTAILLCLAAILVTGCTRSSLEGWHGRSPSSHGMIAWQSCGGGFQCGSLRVPVDYSHPRAKSISLALIRKRATNQSLRIGSVLLNPGGPGESGLQFLRGSVGVFSNLNYRFDLVSWDPRGVGASAPISCLDGPQLDAFLALDSVLDDPAEKQAFIQATRDFVAGCARRNGDLLPFMDTASTARDMDQIREAVGDPKLTYLGFSYGTYIGQWYAHLFPTRVRALSLDGVVDSKANGALGQIAGFEQNLKAFAAACQADSTCSYGQSGEPEAKIEAAMARLDSTPLAVGDRSLTRSLAMRGVVITLYDQTYWPYLDRALTALDKGDGRFLLSLADAFDGRNSDGTYASIANGGNTATSCLDSSVPTDIAYYDRLGPAFAKASPLFGPLVQYAGLECAYWPVRSKSVHEQLTVDGAPPILLVGGTNDPATPYAWAQAVKSQIPSAVLLTRHGNGHTSYGVSLCARSAEDAYLISLVLPAAGTVCDA